MHCANRSALFEAAVGAGDDPPPEGLDVVVDVLDELPHAARTAAAIAAVAVRAKGLAARRRGRVAAVFSVFMCSPPVLIGRGLRARSGSPASKSESDLVLG